MAIARGAADIILTAPGLAVIHEAVTRARITCERVDNNARFRIVETVRIILFMTRPRRVQLHPITALMIILLPRLNALPIPAIAYDNTRINAIPVR